MGAKFAGIVGSVVVAACGSLAVGQSLVAARAANTVNGQGGTDLIVIDPATGSWDFYMRVAHSTADNRQLYHLTGLPDCKLGASLYRDNGSANTTAQYMLIDPGASASTVFNYGAPLATSYIEGIEYSPRHGNLLVSFGALGNFGTNRLAVVNAADGTVISTTSALSGITDMDYIVSTATEDLFIDFNAGTASARIKKLTNPLPATAFTSFASPPLLNSYWDAARHPATNEIVFADTNGTRLVRLVGNAYVNGATLSDGAQVRGLAWANLPPRTVMPAYAGACPGGNATITAHAVGTGPFTYKWRKNGQDINPASNSSALKPTLELPGVSDATLGDYDCVIINACGTHITDAVPFILCVADLNCDGSVDDLDFQLFTEQYNILDCADPGMPAGCLADLNGDGLVEDLDFQLFVPAYDRLLCGE
ncbi:MAG: hypothetical protein JSS51_07150 [Planctomycetes bacterium]|nr:hypothetical protein [Planctomycetota bacterium]